MPDSLQPHPELLWAGAATLVLAGLLIAIGRAPSWLRWGLIFFGTAALWLSYLPQPNLGIDGGLSGTLALLPISEMLAINGADVHPPGFYALLHVWLPLAGLTPFALRYPTVLSGLLVAALIGAIGRRLGGGRAGEIAAWLTAVSPGVGLLAVTVRDFMPGLVVAALAVRIWLELWPDARTPKRGNRLVILLGIAFGLSLWLTYLAGVVVAALGAASVFGGRRLVQTWAVSALIGVATWLPWLVYEAPFFLERATAGQTARTPNLTPEDPLYFLKEAVLALTGAGGILLPPLVGYALVVALFGLTAFTIWQAGKRSSPDYRPLALGLVAAPLALAACYLLMRTWANITAVERYVIFSLPFFSPAIGFVTAARSPRRRLISWGLIGIVGLMSLSWSMNLMTTRYAPREGWWDPVRTVDVLDHLTRPGDAVVFITLEHPVYYQSLSRQPVTWRVVPALPLYVAGDVPANTSRLLDPILPEHDRIWLVAYLIGLGETGQIVNWLGDRYFPVPDQQSPDSKIHGYLTPRTPLPYHRIGAAFVDGLTLESASFPAALGPRSDLPVELVWSVRSTPSKDYTVFVHLVSVDQTKQIAGHDGLPNAGRAATSRWPARQQHVDRHGLLIPADTPGGSYLLVAGLYHDGQRLPLLTGGTQVVLGEVQLER